MTHAPPKELPSKTEKLVIQNGVLIENLFASEAWCDIVFPLISESIAGVSGTFRNGRFQHGDLTRTSADKQMLTGYQRALMDLYNNLHDFIVAKNKLLLQQKQEKEYAKAPVYNTFMESTDGEETES